MANFASVAAVGSSIERFLTAAFAADPPVAGSTTTARMIRTEDLEPSNLRLLAKPLLSILPYRIDLNRTVRAGWSAIGSADGTSHLPVDLHFIVTPWASDASSELRVLGRAMQALETTPILSGPLLLSTGGFAANETIQVVLEDLGGDAVFRMFDTLPADYKLSVPYVARVARIDGRVALPPPPALTVVAGVAPGAPA
jgi:hypothetical protein